MPVDVNGETTTASPTPDDTAIVMYTSGSTGTPKVRSRKYDQMHDNDYEKVSKLFINYIHGIIIPSKFKLNLPTSIYFRALY